MPMKMTYLDYYKLVLAKVSFDYALFKKELDKANQILTKEEQSDLKKWIIANRYNLTGKKKSRSVLEVV